jgi:hypothetical protein
MTDIIPIKSSLLAIGLALMSWPALANTIPATSPGASDIQAAINEAKDGDTVIVPAGTASWTGRLEINKGITLQGQTTIDGAGTANPVIDSKTVIQDDTPTGILRLYPDPSKPLLRVTGITFTHGSRTPSTNWGVLINPAFSVPSTRIRIDHCYFDHIRASVVIGNGGWSYPVVDHNVVDYDNGYAFVPDENSYDGKTNGNGAWADFAWFGSEKFFFIETNTVRNSRGLHPCTDTTNGGRFVYRYNFNHNCLPADHGTEGGLARFDRAHEIYHNVFNFDVPPTNISQRSGNSLIHDNLCTGVKNQNNVFVNINNNRTNSGRSESMWGQADGTSPWDENDTEGNGTFVEGHPPHTFDSGTATSGGSGGGGGRMVDTTKNWRPNQWVGYSIQDTSTYLPYLASYITSSTSNTIVYLYYSATDSKRHLIFAAGHTYAIHRCLRQFDMAGTGKGDLVSADTSGHPINTTTGKASYPHYLSEPTFAWNNKHESGAGQIMKTVLPWIKPNRDYYDLGIGFPADSTPQKVKDLLTASVNGMDYIGPYTYPHPLASGGPQPTVTPAPTASATATATPSVTATATAVDRSPLLFLPFQLLDTAVLRR